MEDLELYIVRNKEGHYFRSKGYGGYGKSWVEDVKDARVYSKVGSARSIVTWWYNNYPDYGIADILVLDVSIKYISNEKDRISKMNKAADKALVKRKERVLNKRKKEIEKELEDLNSRGI